MQEEVEEQDELFEHYSFKVDKGQSSIRIDKFLFDKIVAISRNRIQNAAKNGSVLVNGDAVKSNYKVRPLDEITIVFATPPLEYNIEPEDVGLDVIYEDDSIMIINKQAGLVVHPGHGNFTGTLVHGLLHHQLSWPQINGVGRPGIVHRLDKNTSGVMVVGKTDHALTHLGKQFYDRTINRRYIALVWGDFDEEEGTVKGNIGRNLKNRRIMDVFPDGDMGKHAVTHYKVLQRFGYVTLIECKLETGRTHQIRVHMKHIGHTLFGDYNYGGDKVLKGTVFTKYKQFVMNCFNLMPYHCLHAKSLTLIHPVTKEEMFFERDLPPNFQALIDKWARYTKTFNL